MATKELKEKAQDELMTGLQSAFDGLPDDAPRELQLMMSDQMARVEKLFGYTPYSYGRGI